MIFLLFFAFQLFIYRDAFSVSPSADDYVLPVQIRIGEQAGPLKFLTHYSLGDYRPLQSMTYWAVGRWVPSNPFWLIHILNFVSFLFYALVFAVWIRLARLSLIGVLCATSVLFFHPVIAGPLGDLDGFTRFVVSGWVWLGAYFAFKYANSLRLAIPLVATCFLIGLGFMEYALGLAPLSVLAIWWGRQQERVRAPLLLAGALLLAFSAYYALRISVVGSGLGHLSTSPLAWVTNLVMLGSSVLFMGNTVSIYVNYGPRALVILGIGVLVTSLMLFGSLWTWKRGGESRGLAGTAPGSTMVFGFLASGFLISSLPMIFMKHVSEIYASAIVVPFALQMGYAAAGWMRAPRKYFITFLLAFAIQIAWGCTSVTAKVASLRETGERARQQIQSLLEWIPREAHDVEVALVFLEPELPPRRTYSVFLAGDDHLIQPGGSASSAMEWFRPGRSIRLRHLVVQARSEVKVEDFAMVLYWNPLTRRFELWKRLVGLSNGSSKYARGV